MAEFITPAIPASQLVSVNAGVLPAGGNALSMIAVLLTQSWRIPIGQVYQFPDPTTVGEFFGNGSTQQALASVYFNGFNNSNVKPGQLNFFRYAEDAVGAYLHGASVAGLTLTQLQALSGTLSVTIDAVLQTASVNLSAATSFSNGAQIIQNDLGITGEAAASITAAVGATFTATSSGTNMTTTAVTGFIHTAADGTGVVTTVTGTGISGTVTLLRQTSGTIGGAGVYVTSAVTTCSTASVTAASTAIDVSAVGSGELVAGQLLAGAGVTAHTYLGGQISGTAGGMGVYIVTASQQVVSEAMTTTWPAVAYDSVSGGYIIHSGTTGASSTITFGSGALATSLNLTQATGAVLSQGAAALTNASQAMNAITAITQNWVDYFTDWEPSDTVKEQFAEWASGQNGGTLNRYGYIMWSTNVLDTEQGGPGVAEAYIQDNQLSGTVMVYQNPSITTLGGEKAAFMAGMIASVDYTEVNGDITFAFKAQSGLLPDITDGGTSTILAGNPQEEGVFGYGINFYGDYTTANQAFIGWQRGLVSGPFTWADDYFNEIWLNNQCQLALMVLMFNIKSLPYDPAGYAAVESTLAGSASTPVGQAITFGMIVSGIALSGSQIAEITSLTGLSTAWQAVQNQGYYLKIGPAIAQVRAGRTSPPCLLVYATGESIQAINLASVQAQ